MVHKSPLLGIFLAPLKDKTIGLLQFVVAWLTAVKRGKKPKCLLIDCSIICTIEFHSVWEKKEAFVICYSVAKPWEHHIKWNKPVNKRTNGFITLLLGGICFKDKGRRVTRSWKKMKRKILVQLTLFQFWWEKKVLEICHIKGVTVNTTAVDA